MKIINLKEHQQCNCYVVSPSIGFSVINLQKGEEFAPDDLSVNRFIYIRKGEIAIHVKDEDCFILKSKHFVFVPISKYFNIAAVEKTQMVIMNTRTIENICLKVSLPHLDGVYYNEELNQNNKNNGYKASSGIVSFFNTLVSYLSAGLHCIELQKLKEREFFLLLRATFSLEQLKQLFIPLLGDQIDFKTRVLIYKDEASSVAELSQLMKMDRGHFQKTFKKQFGISPYQWMLKEKAQITLKYLHEKQLPLKVVVSELKFTSQSHLNRFCKKMFGKTAKVIQEEIN